MENLASDLVRMLQYLLPGFLSAWVFYGFTSFAKPSQFERVIQALIFTLLVQVLVYLYQAMALAIGHLWSIASWTSDVELVASVVIAVLLGLLFAYFANTDRFHAVVRKFGISRETSYPSEWYGEFSTRVTYVVLHLDGGRRLYGWPREWPSTPLRGHFAIEQASWLNEKDEIPLEGVGSILIPVEAVRMVEFMNVTWER